MPVYHQYVRPMLHLRIVINITLIFSKLHCIVHFLLKKIVLSRPQPLVVSKTVKLISFLKSGVALGTKPER